MHETKERVKRDDSWQHALALFRRAAESVPAYADFLRRQGFDPRKVVTEQDWQSIPIISKSNYVDRYPLDQLVWNGRLSDAAMVHSSSGTSGSIYYWPCSSDELCRASAIYQRVFQEGFGVSDFQPTLLVVCFGMGTWIAGSYTTATSLLLRQKKFPLTIITPGFNRAETLKVLERLAGQFSRVIIAGIPSFVKDLLDALRDSESPPAPYVLNLLLAGEGFPEAWRGHVCELAGQQAVALSMLGSADAGLIGYESNSTIALRQVADADPELCAELFQNRRVPAILHYDPLHRFIETSTDGELLITADRVLPLIRYNTLDHGGILEPSQLIQRENLAAMADWSKTLPLVYLFGRGAKSASLYGANIYAETIQEFLVDPRIAPHSTGRFVMQTDWLPDFAQQLVVRVELREHSSCVADAATAWQAILVELLRRRSTEFKRIAEEYGEKATPRICLHPFRCPEHFPDVQKKMA